MRIAIAILIALSWLPAAHADDGLSEQTIREAETLLREANAHYAAERYQEARAAYQAAYTLTEAPGFLYNIAQSHRLARECRLAIEYYEKFLAADPESSLRSKIDSFIVEMWSCVDAEKREDKKREGVKAVDTPLPAVVIAKEPRVVAQRERSSGPRSSLPTIGLAVAGVGVLAVGTGAFFGLKARSFSQEVEGFDGPWGASQEAEEADAQSAERIAVVLGAIGGAAMLGGVATFLFTGNDEPSRLTLMPTSSGAMLSFSSTL